MIGMHGARYTNFVLNESDLLIVLGARFDDRATGNVKMFCPEASILHIDVDPSEIDKIKKSNLSIVGDISKVLDNIIPFINRNTRQEWLTRINDLIRENPSLPNYYTEKLHPVRIIREIGKLAGINAIIATDVGQHQMWTAQSYPFRKPRTFLTSGGLGTMGFGLPVSIGAALANPEKQIICISGDGSILMNMQELATMSELGLKIKVIIMNNGHLGLVRQQQEQFYSQNYIASRFISNPNFTKIGQAFGIDSCDLCENDNSSDILEKALLSNGPYLINAHVPQEINVAPIVPPGSANTEMIGGEYYDRQVISI